VLVTSSATGQGLDALAAELLHRVPLVASVAEPAALDAPLAEHRVFRPAAGRGFSVQRLDDGVFKVDGDGILRLLARHDLDNDEALAHVEGRLRRMGVISALEAAGFEPGDDVEIAGVLFELHPG
jgi:GTP-binding protein